MTQPDADTTTKRSARPSRPTPRPTPGTQVRFGGLDEIGTVVPSDDYYDTLQLRGAPISAQVLVEWPRDSGPLRTWELVSNLVTV